MEYLQYMAKKHSKEDEWRRRIERWRASGQSVRELCAREGFRDKSFYMWRRKLATDHSVHDEANFVEVVHEHRTAVSVEIVVGSITVRVPQAFDSMQLHRILGTITQLHNSGMEA